MDKFQINSCIKWIEENQFHIIALQVPDDDLNKIEELIQIFTESIQYDKMEFYLVGDGCSPCCNDLLNAQYCQAQGLIHFGHSCLSGSSFDSDNQQTISIFYVFYQQSLPDDVLKFFSTNNENNKSYSLVFYDPCYRDAIEEYSKTSNRFIFSKIGISDSSDFSLYGRSVHLPVPLDPSNYSIIFISHSKASLNNFALYFTHMISANALSSSKLLSKRIYAIESARNGSSYGLLISSNSLLNLPTLHTLLNSIKNLLQKNNRDYFTFLMNTLSITKMNNFQRNIDIYVLCSSCTESIWLSPENKQFNIPFVSIADIVQAFKENQEDLPMNYSFDLRQILSTIPIPDKNQHEKTNALVLKHPNALLLKHDGIHNSSNNSTWWGLQITKDNNDEKEENSIAELKEGKFGIAAGYTNEKF